MGVKEQYRDYVMTGFVKRVEPVVADHGDGALLYDADGTEYIDCFAGISVTNAGHHNTKILAAAKAQADKLVHACSYVYHVESVGALAEKLAEITPASCRRASSATAAPRPSRAPSASPSATAARTSSWPSSRASTGAPTPPSR